MIFLLFSLATTSGFAQVKTQDQSSDHILVIEEIETSPCAECESTGNFVSVGAAYSQTSGNFGMPVGVEGSYEMRSKPGISVNINAGPTAYGFSWWVPVGVLKDYENGSTMELSIGGKTVEFNTTRRRLGANGVGLTWISYDRNRTFRVHLLPMSFLDENGIYFPCSEDPRETTGYTTSVLGEVEIAGGNSEGQKNRCGVRVNATLECGGVWGATTEAYPDNQIKLSQARAMDFFAELGVNVKAFPGHQRNWYIQPRASVGQYWYKFKGYGVTGIKVNGAYPDKVKSTNLNAGFAIGFCF